MAKKDLYLNFDVCSLQQKKWKDILYKENKANAEFINLAARFPKDNAIALPMQSGCPGYHITGESKPKSSLIIDFTIVTTQALTHAHINYMN